MPAFAACLVLASLAAVAAPSAQVVTYSSSWSSRPVVRIAQDYFLGANESVSDVRLVFGNATIEGRVEGDIFVVFGEARLTGQAVVEGSVVVIGGSAEIASTAAVERDLVVIGGTLTGDGFSRGGDQVVVGSVWLGGILRGVVPWMTRGLIWGRLIVPDIDWVWTVVGIFFVLYLLLNIVFDRAVGASADVAGARPISTFLSGLLVLVLSLPVMALLFATVIGIALLPFIVCALLAAGLVGKAGIARAMGRGLMRSESAETMGRGVAAFTIGFALLTLAYMVPIIGFITWALTTVMGFGAATTTFRAMLRKERPEPPPAPARPPATAADAPMSAPPAAVRAEPAEPAMFAEPAMPAMAAEPPVRALPAGNLSSYPRATFLDRLAAFALDAVLVAIACELLDWNRYEGFYLFVLLAYHVAFWSWRGTTMGGIIIGLRVIRTHGADLRPADAIVRGLSSIFSLGALGIGCFWMIQDPERQTWHDKIAGTLVVKVPRDQVLP